MLSDPSNTSKRDFSSGPNSQTTQESPMALVDEKVAIVKLILQRLLGDGSRLLLAHGFSGGSSKCRGGGDAAR
jgi:hypothetical protein